VVTNSPGSRGSKKVGIDHTSRKSNPWSEQPARKGVRGGEKNIDEAPLLKCPISQGSKRKAEDQSEGCRAACKQGEQEEPEKKTVDKMPDIKNSRTKTHKERTRGPQT